MECFKADNAFLQRALKYFDRTEQSVNEDVQILKEWLKTQKHLPEIMDDAKIRNFLFINKCSIENTKKKIDMYYTIRSAIPCIFENSNPRLPLLKEFASQTYICSHPKLIDDLYRVAFVKMKKPNVTLPNLVTLTLFNSFEIRLKEDLMVNQILFVDASNTSLEDLMKFTPASLKIMHSMFNSVYCFRIKEMHILNSVPYVGQILKIFKMLLKDKVFQRIYVHQDSEVLKKFFTQEELPKDYGGDGPALQDLTDWLQSKFDEYKDRFDELDKLRVNENLRPEPMNNDEILGFHGNFKKLNVD